MATDETHRYPVWRDRANFIIGTRLCDGYQGTEQLWAVQHGDRYFELCCIPFFAYNMALGDVVETDHRYDVVRVVQPSGRHVFRAWFGGSSAPAEEIASTLTDQGALLEWWSPDLIAVDACDAAHARLITALLDAHERAGRLMYEAGRV